MINGVEDLYEQKTGVRLPERLLFYLSGMAGFVYIRNRNAPTPRMVFWGMQVAKYQYAALADVVGFTWQMVENRSFPFTLARAKEAVDHGIPPLLGALDMYHLPYYEKFYHNFHIPIHHVLMAGYDDDRQAVLVLDCDRPDVQTIPYTDLAPAWDVTIPGMGKKNTFYTFTFDDQVADVETITRKGLAKQAAAMLDAPVSMLGLKGMRKLARELPAWPEELSAEQLDISLRHLTEFTGFPPVLPPRLIGFGAPDNHAGGRDVFADLLRRLADMYGTPAWAEAAALFERSGEKLVALTDTVVDYLLKQTDTLNPAASRLAEIADLEETAWAHLAEIVV